MKKIIIVIILLVIVLSCKGEGRTVRLQISDKIIDVEISDTEQSRAMGLMHRKSLKENSGMLFIFKDEQRLSFWMKNTIIPLSIAYISRSGEIKEIHQMYPLDEQSVSSTRSVMYALEMNQGWFKKNNVSVGEYIIIPENL